MTPTRDYDKEMMTRAIELGQLAKRRGDYAIGAVLVQGDRDIVAEGGNRVKEYGDSTRHIELELIQLAVSNTNSHYLPDVTLYSTHAPCPMCLTAAVWARLKRVVYALNQSDIAAHAVKNATAIHHWRSVDIEPAAMYAYLKRAHPGMEIIQLMRGEAMELFGNAAKPRNKKVDVNRLL